MFVNRSHLESEHKLESLISRESSFLFNNVLLLVSAFAVLWGTLFPVLSEWVTGHKVTVDLRSSTRSIFRLRCSCCC